MANYVLVHGAWGGAHSYDKTVEGLQSAGHTVVLVHLRGLGSRQPELTPGITLSDHADDVCQAIEASGVDRFILAGHSYGGAVITKVATRLGARIDAIVYLDAFVPGDGQSLWDVTGPIERNWYVDSQKDTPGLVAPIGSIRFEEVPGRVGRHPLLTLLEAVRYTGEEAKIPRRVYVFATEWSPTPFTRFADHARSDAAWEYHDCAAGHHVMYEQPEQILAILTELA